MNADEYLRNRLEDQIDWYDRKSMSSQRWFKRLRGAEIFLAAAIPLLSGFANHDGVPLIIGVMSASIATIAGVLGLNQFERRWIEYRTTCESLKKERFFYLARVGPYIEGDRANFSQLVQRVESLISKENTSWANFAGGRDQDDKNVPTSTQ